MLDREVGRLSGPGRTMLVCLAPIYGGETEALEAAIAALYSQQKGNVHLGDSETATAWINIGRVASVKVDADEYDRIQAAGHWRKIPSGNTAYAATTINGKTVLMHRLIVSAPTGSVVDHINGDGLDNRRCNLRICTMAQNFHNAKPYQGKRFKGVWKRKGYDLWYAAVDHKRVPGSFRNEIDAARAYNRAARERYGEYAWLNDIPDGM